MWKLFKYVFLLGLIGGGWALAAAALHVVRAPAPPNLAWLPVYVEVVPKGTLTYQDTWVDVTAWNRGDVAARPAFEKRLADAGKSYLLNTPRSTMAPVLPVIDEAPCCNVKDKPAEATYPVSVPAPATADKAVKVEKTAVKVPAEPVKEAAPKVKSIFSED